MDRAIHEAALELFSARGLSGVSIEDVATRAGVARTTVYRRYDNIADMVEAAADDLLAVHAPDPGLEGRDAWRQIVESLRKALFDSNYGLPLLAALIVAEREHPDLLTIWRERVVKPRVEMISTALGWPVDQARQLGQLALGGLIGSYLAQGVVGKPEARSLADQLWDRLAPPAIEPENRRSR